METNDTSLQTTKNNKFLKRILSFFKNLVKGKSVQEFSVGEAESKNSKEDNFMNSIKFTEDPDKKMLLSIQAELKKRGINKKNAYELTKDLNEIQKKKLIDLYKEQIVKLKKTINNYKNSIIKIRKGMNS